MSNPEPVSAEPVPTLSVTEDRTVAIVSYLTIIGFIVAVVIHGNKKTALGTYHLRQSLGLMLAWVAMMVLSVIPVLGWLVLPIVGLGLFVLWILGLIAAINGEQKPVPLLGEHFQKWFAGAFA